ncbi:Hypothetical predicted protein [Pelobates cultripes]|uniref:Uncharacterized protein n=1 Tax=Pelobates cultripes TaxID=61616 RepID=A0AAD1VQ81_PELCU|nr:Hypothetical predicted protein [Pelobates cultripes]
MAPAREDSDLASEDSDHDDSSYYADRGEPSKSTPLRDRDPKPVRASKDAQPDHAPASKADIQNMVAELKAYFSADIALVREDMGVMTARLRALEEAGTATTSKQEALQPEVETLKQANHTMEGRLAVLEDARWQRNMRVRGIPENIGEDEVPHYLHRMWSSMLPPAKAKTINLDYLY